METQGVTSGKDVQERLLDAAEALFAENGFDATSVRDITAKAGCNLASVNYHFGEKQKLYDDVFRRRLREMRERRLAAIATAMANPQGVTVEDIIRADASAFLEPFADRDVSRRCLMLFTREMVENRLAKGIFLDEMVTPMLAALEQSLRRVAPGLSAENARMSIYSVIGQLVHAIHIRLMPEIENESFGRFSTSQLIDHIVKFSAAGIHAYAGEAGDAH